MEWLDRTKCVKKWMKWGGWKMNGLALKVEYAFMWRLRRDWNPVNWRSNYPLGMCESREECPLNGEGVFTTWWVRLLRAEGRAKRRSWLTEAVGELRQWELRLEVVNHTVWVCRGGWNDLPVTAVGCWRKFQAILSSEQAEQFPYFHWSEMSSPPL